MGERRNCNEIDLMKLKDTLKLKSSEISTKMQETAAQNLSWLRFGSIMIKHGVIFF